MSEWQIEKDSLGIEKRYRMVDGIKEYEMKVTVDGREVPESQKELFLARSKAEKQKLIELERQKPKIIKACPLRDCSTKTTCKEDCIFYDDGCMIAKAGQPTQPTVNKYCPMHQTMMCHSSCAWLVNDGCILTGIIKQLVDKRGDKKA